ncbi:hypothetical protein [Rhodoferax sp.]|uniref:hypothetical protein n=1 Tax=Rhodoferax sp. TaxID=50421 RepID=UPI0019F40CD2|nr:hypothetical protein [Rhodoferax sp.]MBE0474726.1 hypothetical protein [Rhodoferax sp.]
MSISPSPAQNPALDRARAIVRTVDVGRPLAWLARAWHDLTRCGWISVLHGVAIALIMMLTFAGFATALIGLVLLVPLLGHAGWHAYRDLLDVSALPEREQR